MQQHTHILLILTSIIITLTTINLIQQNTPQQQTLSQLQSSQSSYPSFSQWLQKHNKKYNPDIYLFRNQIYKQNIAIIQQHNNKANQGIYSYWLGINQFSDLTDKQWVNMYLISQQYLTKSKDNKDNTSNNYTCSNIQPSDKDLPQAIDWAAKSAVTAVKNNGMCTGASYAITAAQAIQSGHYITSGKLLQLSIQQIIDCSTQYGNHGCISGNMTYSYAYIQKYGITTNQKYPYRQFAYTCNYTINMKQAQILGCVKVTSQKQTAIKAAVRRQPIAASINAAKLKSYSKGVYEASGLFTSCKTQHNHWMLLVGYGRDQSAKKNYWKLKNSWGAQWGLQGYLYIVRKGDGEGQCGVQTQLYYPIA